MTANVTTYSAFATCEREARLDEEEIEAQDVEHRREDRRSAAVTQSRHRGAQQEHHHQIGFGKKRVQGPGHGHADHADQRRPPEAIPVHGRRVEPVGAARGRRSSSLPLGDHRYVDAGCVPEELRRGRRPKESANAAPGRCPDHDAGDIARARVLQERRCGGRPVERDGLRAERFREPEHRHSLVPRSVLSRSIAGVSTETTIHSASSASAKRLPKRTSSSAWSSGPMPTRKRSRASHGREAGSRPHTPGRPRRRGRRCGAAQVRAARSGSACGRIARARRRPAPARRPCRPSAVRAGRPGAGRSARSPPPPRPRGPAPSPAAGRR